MKTSLGSSLDYAQITQTAYLNKSMARELRLGSESQNCGERIWQIETGSIRDITRRGEKR